MRLEYADMIGKPFEEFGRGPDAYDCYGVCIELSRRGGHPIPDYGSVPCSAAEEIDAKIRAHFHLTTKVTMPEPLDLVLLTGEDGPTHLGIFVENLHYLTTTKKTGVIRVNVNHHIWKHLMRGFFRWIPQYS